MLRKMRAKLSNVDRDTRNCSNWNWNNWNTEQLSMHIDVRVDL